MLLHRSLLRLSWEEVRHEEVSSHMESFQCVCGDASVKHGLNESDCWPSLQFDRVVEAFCAQLSPKLFFFLFTPSNYLPLSVPLFHILQALDSLFSFEWLQEIATAILQDTCLVQLSHWHNKLVPPFQSAGLHGQWRPAPQIHPKKWAFCSAVSRDTSVSHNGEGFSLRWCSRSKCSVSAPAEEVTEDRLIVRRWFCLSVCRWESAASPLHLFACLASISCSK